VPSALIEEPRTVSTASASSNDCAAEHVNENSNEDYNEEIGDGGVTTTPPALPHRLPCLLTGRPRSQALPKVQKAVAAGDADKVQLASSPTNERGEEVVGTALPEVLEEKMLALMALRDGDGPVAGLSDFAKEYGDEAFCLRLLRKYEGDMRRCTQQYTTALRWRERKREMLTTRNFKLAGDYRVIGADKEQRAVLYMCMKNQFLSGSQGLDHSLVALLQAIDNLPPGVEKTVHIWDLHGMKLHLNLNPTPTYQMAQAQEGYFAERLHELIIIDMPRLATFIKDAVWPLIPQKTKCKVRFLTRDEARAHVQSVCDEATAQRICDSMTENRDPSVSFEQRLQSWRRVNQHGDLVPLGP